MRLKLNEVHGVCESQRYWDIVCAWWATYFTHIYWDRWESIRTADQLLDSPEFESGLSSGDPSPPATKMDFIQAFQGDNWNQGILEQIAREHFGWRSYTPGSRDVVCGDLVKETVAANYLRSLAQDAKHVFARIDVARGDAQKVAFWADYMRPVDRWRVCRNLSQWPNYQRPRSVPLPSPQIEARSWKFSFPQNDFESALASQLVRNMPVSYLEGYETLQQAAEEVRWPKHPDVVATGIGHYSYDLFGIWAAERVKAGSKLAVLQHGGTYGIAGRSAAQNHDHLVADVILSWGWASDKAVPSSSVKLMAHKPAKRQRSRRKLLVVAADLFRYSHHLTSCPTPSQQYRVLADLSLLLDGLREEILERTKLRMLSVEGGLDAEAHLLARYPRLEPTDRRRTFAKEVRSSSVVLCTDNSTTMIESMFLNRPTVVYWDPEFNALSPAGRVAMDRLAACGVFHDTAPGAATHIERIWASPGEWWDEPETRLAVKLFLDEFGFVEKSPHQSLAAQLRNLSHVPLNRIGE